MPSHQIASTELNQVTPDQLLGSISDSLLDRFRKELNFDYEIELGRCAQRVAKNSRLSDIDKLKALSGMGLVLKSLRKIEGTGRISGGGNVQVNVMTMDPTKP